MRIYAAGGVVFRSGLRAGFRLGRWDAADALEQAANRSTHSSGELDGVVLRQDPRRRITSVLDNGLTS